MQDIIIIIVLVCALSRNSCTQEAYKPIAGLHLLVWSITLQALCLVLFKHSGFYFHVFVLRTLKVYHPTMKHGATKSKICSGLRHDLNDYCFPFGCPAHILIHFFSLSFYCYLVALCPVTLPVCTFLENFPLQYAYTHTRTHSCTAWPSPLTSCFHCSMKDDLCHMQPLGLFVTRRQTFAPILYFHLFLPASLFIVIGHI